MNVAGVALLYLVNGRQMTVPTSAVDVLNVVGPAGAVIVVVRLVLLGIRGKLPGTRVEPRRARGGFPLD